jgi:hypothetical protein
MEKKINRDGQDQQDEEKFSASGFQLSALEFEV